MISRRDALKIGATGVVALSMISRINPVMASQGDPAVWNWRGNAGHTGEMPGPGLDFGEAIGEIWRLPPRENAAFVGLLNHTAILMDGFKDYPFESGWKVNAFNCLDGTLIWSRTAPGFDDADYEANNPERTLESIRFSPDIVIVGNMVLLTLSDGRLWAIDASLGNTLWEFNSEYERVGALTVIGSTGILIHSRGILSLSLANQAQIIWDVETENAVHSILGVDHELIWLTGRDYISALDITSGVEYWRIQAERGLMESWLGLVNKTGIFGNYHAEIPTAIDDTGAVKWMLDNSDFDIFRAWISKDNYARATEPIPADRFQSCDIQCVSIEDGGERWSFQVDAGRWWLESKNYNIRMCDGIAYALVMDKLVSEPVLIAVDPDALTISGARGVNLDPIIVSGGYIIAIDLDTDEFVCIGRVPGTLHADGQAKVTQTASMYGAPNTSSADRGQVTEGMRLTVTGEAERTSEGVWLPVTLTETGTSGWLPAESMEGLDGDIVFESIDPSEFGILTSHQP